MYMRRFITATWLIMAACTAFAQHHAPAAEMHSQPAHNQAFQHFRVAAIIGHTLIPARHADDNLFIPSWGLDLEYWWNPTWGIGLHNDLELESFIIERPSEEILERNYPLVMTLDLLYKPWGGLVLMAGPGYEVADQEDFFLLRLGLEYEIDFGHHWDLAPTLFYDSREDSFQTWSIGLGVGKRF